MLLLRNRFGRGIGRIIIIMVVLWVVVVVAEVMDMDGVVTIDVEEEIIGEGMIDGMVMEEVVVVIMEIKVLLHNMEDLGE